MPQAHDTPKWLTSDVPRRVPVLAAIVIAVTTAAAFWPASSAGLCLFDDPIFLIENNGWRASNPGWLEWIFTSMVHGHYQPLTYLSYAMEEQLFGIVPPALADVCTERDVASRGYHVTNIVLHVLNTLLVYAVALRVMRSAARDGVRPLPDATGAMHLASAACAVLWGVNPLRVESVAWVTERRDVLSAFFLLLATLWYLRWGADLTRKHMRLYLLTVAALLLSLLSKAWGMSFFVLATLLDVYPLRRLPLWPWRWFTKSAAWVLAEKLPMVVLGVVFAAVAARAQADTPFIVHSLERWGVESRMAQVFYGVVFYLWKSVWPTRLSALYELPPSARLAEARWLVPMVVVVVGAAAVVFLARKRPGLAVAAAAYVVLVAPVLGLFQSGIQLVAERYAYLSLIPVFIACGVVFSRGLSRGAVRGHGAVLAGAGLLGISALWFTMTWRQSMLWHNTRYLWEDALANGHDGVMLRTFHANHLWNDREVEAAEAEFRKGVAIDPTYGDAWMGLAMIARERQDWAGARGALVEASKDPRVRPKSELLLGLMFMNESQLNDPGQGLAHFQASVAAMEEIGGPAMVGRPYLHLGMAYGILGDDANAAKFLKKAARYRDSKKEAEEFLRDLAAPDPALLGPGGG